jgi:putative nucleotidyltransferase with HDIG domain/PAS domain S-box-containing protein
MGNMNKILIVEDELIIAESIKKSLMSLNYEVTDVVTSGQEAIDSCQRIKPDIVLMDIKLEKDMTGIEAADEILKNFEIPSVFLTSYGDQDTLEKAALSQPYGYILKPFEDKELYAAIKMAIYKFKMEEKLRNNQKFLKQIIDNDPNLIYVFDKNNQALIVNKALGNFLNVDHNKLLGKKLTAACPEKKILQEYENLLQNNISNGFIQLEIPSAEENKKFFKMNKVELITPDNTPCTLSVAVDITELKNTQNELKNSYLKLQNLFKETVKGLASAAEKRDPYTAGHQRRVAALAVKISEQMQLDQNTINGIYLTALIHDIGKILIPAEILSKPGKLSHAESEYIKRHPKEGHDILKNIDFPWPVADIVLQHHEKMDGSSYPLGLKGDEILLEARIICVADVIEAMSSHRPYRPARGIETALAEIDKNKGILYDEEVVNACIYVFKELKFEFPPPEM